MPMKVIVCFDTVRVTVPCGEGAIPVKELINKAVHRYKRAVGKGSNHWVDVTSLKTISGGGILDPDDLLSDVVDDREQLIAEYEEHNRPSIPHNGGDGASASSTGTISPDIFQNGETILLDHPANVPSIPVFPLPRHNSSSSNNAATDVVVTPRDLSLGSNLRVRRGSEPNINLLADETPLDKNPAPVNRKPSIPRRESVRDSDDPRSESSDEDKKVKVTMHGSLDRKKLGHNRFSRDALRTSLSNRPEMYRWLEAQEKVEQFSKQKVEQFSKQKVEQFTKKTQPKERLGTVEGHDGNDGNILDQCDSLICLQNDGGPLGIHAIPAFDEKGKDMGLLIQSIEPDRPVYKDGRIKPDDIITEINGTSLQEVPFLRAQDIFRAAMDTKEIRLKIIKGSSSNAGQPFLKKTVGPQPPPVLPKPRSHTPMKPSPLTLSANEQKVVNPVPAPREGSKNSSFSTDSSNGIKPSNYLRSDQSANSSIISSNVKTASASIHLPKNETLVPTKNNDIIKPGPPIKLPKKPPPAIPARNPNTALTGLVGGDAPLNAVTNTRRIGKKLVIQLKKGPLGLGFSVTSRDNQTDGNCPIYIRNILPKGAAVQDGQLRPGDRLLEVNGVEMTGKTQAEAVTFLRMIPEGSQVELVVSRQEEVDEKFKVPRKLGDKSLPAKEGEDNVDGRMDDVVTEGQPDVLQPSHTVDEIDSTSPGVSVEKITLHIPLNDTGSAGLGVSVKGKTESFETSSKDLGIFVKTILQGGAAYKDGHLQVNDQLLEVNGVRLEGLSNTSAMEALRLAMMEDGQASGYISLTIARRTGLTSPSLYGDSPDTSQSEIIPPVVHQRSSSGSDSVTVIHQRSSSASETSVPHSQRLGSDKDLPSPIPPVRSRRVSALRDHFTEQMGNGLRNESYTKATQDSFNDSSAFVNVMPSTPKQVQGLQTNTDHNRKENTKQSDVTMLPTKLERPHSTIGFIHGQNKTSPSDEEDAFVSVSSAKDEDLTSDLLLPFEREGFGRQSMSEKRKGHLDPRSTEIYKMVKANKETKGGFLGRRVRSFHITGVSSAEDVHISEIPPKDPPQGPLEATEHNKAPHLRIANDQINLHVTSDRTYQPNAERKELMGYGMKRSSSEEGLASADPGSATSSNTLQGNQEVSPNWRNNRFGRGRACNDSFRAAVDRSYDVLDPAIMDTLEEESAESGAFTLDPSHSGRSSISSEAMDENNSLKRQKAKDKDKKGGLLKGFLRFGKGRKSNEEAMRRSRSEERTADRVTERRADYSSERPTKDRWMVQNFDAVKAIDFIPISEPGQGQQQQRGRRTSEEERIEAEYARLREHIVLGQNLKSQSTDQANPSTRNNTVVSPSASNERQVAFQPYATSTQQQQQNWHQQQLMMERQQKENTDPRNFHPAAVARGSQVTGREYRENKPYFEMNQEEKPSVTKAVMSRAEYIQQLRSLYQQRHRQRQGVYPLDDTEEHYEQQIQDLEHTWSSENSFDEGTHLPQFSDRPPSRHEQQIPKRPNSASTTLLNVNNSSAAYSGSQPVPYQQHPKQYNGPHSQGYVGSWPNSRSHPAGHEKASYFPAQVSAQSRSPYPQHIDYGGSGYGDLDEFERRYSRRDNVGGPRGYDMYDPRSYPPYHIYKGPPTTYHNHGAPHQYTHPKRNSPFTDSSSAKV
ncbi:unnamed protein product [Lymnaea stagnalis]|uniref:PDZ domain-containing protein n=1 Tax=Lymnaea stagnalis TaxID=6523 RepID=A0AAV2I5A9_LYMST